MFHFEVLVDMKVWGDKIQPSTLSLHIHLRAHMHGSVLLNRFLEGDLLDQRAYTFLNLTGIMELPSICFRQTPEGFLPYNLPAKYVFNLFHFCQSDRQKQYFISNFLVENIQNLLNSSGSEIPLLRIYLKEIIKDGRQDVHWLIICNLNDGSNLKIP